LISNGRTSKQPANHQTTYVLEAGSLAILRDRYITEISCLWQWTMSNKCSIVTDLWKII